MPLRQPNILVVTLHDTGRHFGCYGVPTVHSPHIDRLAGEGVLFTRMFATSPICSPSRASLLTGQYPARHGLVSLAGGHWKGALADPRRHLSHLLRQHGWHTLMCGHQHEAMDQGTLGFDRSLGGGAEDGRPYADRIAEQVEQFLRQRRPGDRPFYAQVGFLETHTPYDRDGVPPDDSLGVYVPPIADDPAARRDFANLSSHLPHTATAEQVRRHLAGLQGSIRVADLALGRILQALRDTGHEPDTLVLLNVDHGVELPHCKWTLYDGGTGVAFILRWPAAGIAGGRRCDWLLDNTDFLPTLRDLLGLHVPHRLDGVSFAPALLQHPAPSPARAVARSMMHFGDVYALRSPRRKILRCLKFGVKHTAQGYAAKYPFELFDLEQDPLERRDVSADPAYAADLADLSNQFWRWLEDQNDPILRKPAEW